MSYKKETFIQLFDLFNVIANSITRKNASKDKNKIDSREFILIKAYNSILVQVKYCLAAESNDKQEVEEKLEKVEETLAKCLGLTSKILIPVEKLGLITKERPENITNSELGIEKAIEKINEQKGQVEIINLIEEIDTTRSLALWHFIYIAFYIIGISIYLICSTPFYQLCCFAPK